MTNSPMADCSISTGEGGEIISPAIHDAQLLGVHIPQTGHLALTLTTVGGKKLSILLTGVERVRATDFRQENIVLDATISKGSDLDAADVAAAYGLSDCETPFVLKETGRLQESGALLVRLNPSYGCSLVCICAQIGVQEHDQASSL